MMPVAGCTKIKVAKDTVFQQGIIIKKICPMEQICTCFHKIFTDSHL